MCQKPHQQETEAIDIGIALLAAVCLPVVVREQVIYLQSKAMSDVPGLALSLGRNAWQAHPVLIQLIVATSICERAQEAQGFRVE